MPTCSAVWKAVPAWGGSASSCTARPGLFDPGWTGKATLELSNLSRMAVALYPGMRICSFTFEQLSSPSSVPYRQEAGQ